MLYPYIESATALSDYYIYINIEEMQEFSVFVGRKKWTSCT